MCYFSLKTNAAQTTLFTSTRPTDTYLFVSMGVSVKLQNIRIYLKAVRLVFYELRLSTSLSLLTCNVAVHTLDEVTLLKDIVL